MQTSNQDRPDRYRVWIAIYESLPTSDLRGDISGSIAQEPAEEGTMSASEAVRYVETFNRIAMLSERKVRALALPVTIQYQGDPRPGQVLPNAATENYSLRCLHCE